MQMVDKLPRGLGKYLTRKNLSLAVIGICCLVIGPLQNYTNYLSAVLLLAMVINFNDDEFYIYSVVYLFFWQQFFLFGDNPAYRFYSYLALAKFILEIRKAQFRVQFLPAIVVFAAFCIFAVGQMTMRMGLNMLADVLLAYLILLHVRMRAPLMRRMVMLYIASAIFSGIYSLTGGGVVEYEVGIGAIEAVVRYYGTLADANYAGFFFDMAIFMALCTDTLKKPIFRLPVLAALYYFLLMTNSFTGLICNVVGVSLYFLLRYRGKGMLLVMGFAVGVVVFVWAILNVPALSQIDLLRSLSVRVSQQLGYYQLGQVSNFFTGRTDLWSFSWNYFTQLPLLNKLIGGTVITSVVTIEYFLENVGAIHQTYLQGMLDFGILGALLVFGTKVGQLIADIGSYFQGKVMAMAPDLMRITILCAVGWFIYALTIDFFMDWRFLFFYFL